MIDHELPDFQLEAEIIRLASRYAEYPDEGYAAGFAPDYGAFIHSGEIGRDDVAVLRERDTEQAWLYGIAKKVLPDARDWTITPMIGSTMFEVHRRRA